MNKKLLIGNISVPYDADDEEIFRKAKKKVKSVGISPSLLDFSLYKRSIDARKQRTDGIFFVCSVIAESCEPIPLDFDKLKRHGITVVLDEELMLSYGNEPLSARPVVVGMGPAGMFCALLLAENGYAPIVIERGDDVERRAEKVDKFYKTGILDAETNIQFGAGGAGTFSDGKLVTRINDGKCTYVLRRLREFGAPKEILVKAKPHIGTDILRSVVKNVSDRIVACGGEIRYNTRLDEILPQSIKTSCGEIPYSVLVLALGHSARDSYKMLLSSGYELAPKPFSVGVRIEHLQEDIDRALFGKHAGDSRLGKGEYNLSDTKGERGVYTFCMCPGGEVVAAASEYGGVVVNGMSKYARDGKNANSAIAVSVLPSDIGGNVEDAISFQRNLEIAAFEAGGGGYRAPLQTVGDFFEGKVKNEPKRIQSTYMGGDKFKICNLGSILPCFVTENLKLGIKSFAKRLSGFDVPDAILTGVETRTSAPLRILRGDRFTAIGRDKIYPCGEGAGYAGGITSAAVDGVKVAIAIMEKYAPIQ